MQDGVNVVDGWAFGIVIVIGGQFIGWNEGLEAGYGSFLIGTISVGIAFFGLVLCLAEIGSALPFPGVGFGLTRIALGHYPGFVIGTIESLEYVLYVVATVLILGSHITKFTSLPSSLEPLWWLLFFVISFLYNISSFKLFWRLNLSLGLLCLATVVIYCFGSMSRTDFQENIVEQNTEIFDGGLTSFLYELPLAAWWYIGVECIILLANDISQPRVNLPPALLLCMGTLFVTSLFILTITPSLSPGLDSMINSISPLDQGYSSLFSIPERYGILFTLPGLFATAHGFIYAGSIQISSMGQSKLFPEILGRTVKRDRGSEIQAASNGPTASRRDTRLFHSLFVSGKQSESTVTQPLTALNPSSSGLESAESKTRDSLQADHRPSSSRVRFTLSEASPPTPSLPASSLSSSSTDSTSPNKSSVPIPALLFTSLLCYFLCLLCTFVPYLSQIIFPLSTCCGYLMYLSILCSYIIFKLRYSSCKRYFVNPGGILSALLSFLIFTICVISLLIIRPVVDIYRYLHREDTEHERSLISVGIPFSLAICLAVLTLYYHRVARGQMHYSEDEQKEMFTLLLINRRRSQLQSIRRATFTARPSPSPAPPAPAPPQTTPVSDNRDTFRSTSIYSFASFTSYLSSRVSFAITRERAYSSSSGFATALSSPINNPAHGGDLDTDSEGGEEESMVTAEDVSLRSHDTADASSH